MSKTERLKRTLARWERHLDALEPATVGDAVDLDMERDDLHKLKAFVETQDELLNRLAQGLDTMERNAEDAYNKAYLGSMLKDVEEALRDE